jgi:hypothetical protein
MKRLAILLPLLVFMPVANAQTSSATISGLVTDATGGAIVGADVQLTNDLTKQQNDFKTDRGGRYQFQVAPGDYTLHVAQSGFKAYDQKITVGQAERFANPQIKLQVGDVTTSVEVQGEIAHVQTDSSDRTITVNQTQIQDTPSAGRNYLNILRSLPGTATTKTTDGRGGTGAAGGGGAPAVNGGAGQLLVTINGIASQDSGAPGTGGYQAPSVDAIGEVQVMVSNYTAQYGARNGGQMNVVIKNGTSQFHGTGYYYYRHEEFNANEWFNNRNTRTVNGIPGQPTAKPLYRWQNPGGTIGGPLFIPGHFNRDRNKLFFFYSDDELHHIGTNGPNHYTMPTALERRGDFSQTFTTGGVQIPIYNPLNNQVQYTNNQIPASQINPQGYAMLNLFPVPCGGNACTTSNGLDPTGGRAYNFTDSFKNSSPLTDRILRIDAPLGKSTSFYVSALQDYYATHGAGSLLQSSGAGWGQFLSTYGVPNVNLAANLVHTFTPNLINEFTAGINRSFQIVDADDNSDCTASIDSIGEGEALPYPCSLRSNPNLKGPDGQAVTFPDLFPGANDQNLLPNINFTTAGGGFSRQIAPTQGVQSAPAFGVNTRWPFRGTDQITSVTDTVSWIKGTHTVKFGFYLEHDSRNVTIYNNFNIGGSAYFDPDRANPNDTNWAYSNALIGSMFAYGTDNKRQINHSRYTTYEGFIQDTWKVSRRLTLDYGLRIQSIGPVTDKGADLGFFDTATYNQDQVGQLLFPACTVAVTSSGCAKANLIAVNPATGKQYPFAQVGTFDPASYASGSYPWSGAKFYKSSFWNRDLNLGPRIGFAYDVFGDGKMAVRGGFGMFYGRATSTDNIGASGAGTGPTEVAPLFLAPSYSYPTFASLSGATASYAPQTVYGGTPNILNPQTIQWSFGIQRDLGLGTIMDVSYLGWVTHHGFALSGYDLNGVAPYTTWRPTPGPDTNSCGQVLRYLDPTAKAPNASNCTGGAGLNTNLIRALVGFDGWQAIHLGTNSGESNYNALQVQFNKRFGKRLQFGVNYTWSKNLSYSNNERDQWLDNELTYNVTSGNRPQVVNVNFGYKLQNGTSLLPSGARNYVTKLFLDGWNINGVMSFYDGQPWGVTCSASGAPVGYWFGTPTDTPNMRCAMNGSMFQAGGNSAVVASGSNTDPRLFMNLNVCNNAKDLNNHVIPCTITSPGLVLPDKNSFGLGNTPLTLLYGAGFENEDISVSKTITLGAESRTLEFRAEAFNILNHFNPSNPSSGNSTVTYDFVKNTQTNANLGTITGAQNTARHMALSLRFRF